VFIFCWLLPFTLICTYIIIIIIIRHQLGLDRPVSASSNSLFQGLSNRLRPLGLQFSITSGIMLVSILAALHVVANLVCIFLVSRQLVPLSTLPKFLHSFLWSKTVYPSVLLKPFISVDVFPSLSFSLSVQIPLTEPVYYILVSLKISGPKLV
jgi:hypothetical protein